jgi:magnesium chelatase accessory protein
LLQAEAFRPSILIGHSAGAALAVRLAPQMSPRPRQVIALNGALKPFSGPAALIAPLMAKALAINPIACAALARGGRDPARVEKLIEGTGSRPGPDYLKFYGRLFGSPAHVSGTLRMMAGWDVSGLMAPFTQAGLALHQIVGANDRAVPASLASELAARYPGITAEHLDGLGHLAHEEDAGRVAASILACVGSQTAAMRRCGT